MPPIIIVTAQLAKVEKLTCPI